MIRLSFIKHYGIVNTHLLSKSNLQVLKMITVSCMMNVINKDILGENVFAIKLQ